MLYKKTKKKTSCLFKIILIIIKAIYPKVEIVGKENVPNEPVVIVGNHAQIHGPIACELFMSDSCDIWCTGEMMDIKEVPAYAFKDFWSQKPKYTHWFYKIVSYIIAPLATVIFNNACTIAVYRDSRIIKTFRDTLDRLTNNINVIIFPEHDVKHNNIVYDFQDKFIHVAKMYYKQTGKEIEFVPMYVAPKLKKIYLGKPIRYNHENPAEEERRRICDYMMNEISEMAYGLPEHTVIPYRNIPKKLYPKNIKGEK